MQFLLPEPVDGSISQDDFFRNIDVHRASTDVFIGIGDNQVRRRIFEKLRSYDVIPANCIAVSTFVASDVQLGAGLVICPGAVVMTGARLGHNVIINTHSSVDHDCWVGDHSQVTAGVTFGGQTRVGESCFFGIKSATIPGITIGDHTIVMAGALVTKDAPSHVVLGGSPASIVKRNV